MKLIAGEKIAAKVPLSYYRNKSFNIVRNDALDRFGTPLEQRFSKKEITEMMENAGLKDLLFSNNTPYWHVTGKKHNETHFNCLSAPFKCRPWTTPEV